MQNWKLTLNKRCSSWNPRANISWLQEIILDAITFHCRIETPELDVDVRNPKRKKSSRGKNYVNATTIASAKPWRFARTQSWKKKILNRTAEWKRKISETRDCRMSWVTNITRFCDEKLSQYIQVRAIYIYVYRFVFFFLISHNNHAVVTERSTAQHSPSVKFNRSLIRKKKTNEEKYWAETYVYISCRSF